jgi:hypothetical protein
MRKKYRYSVLELWLGDFVFLLLLVFKNKDEFFSQSNNTAEMHRITSINKWLKL